MMNTGAGLVKGLPVARVPRAKPLHSRRQGGDRVTDPATDSPVESAWTKLRRRKVVQWGVAYAAGSWGFLQGVQFLAETFEWSGRVLKLSTLAFALGLPVVLVLAWYHGDRGEQRVRGTELAIVTLLFLIGGGLFWRYHSASEPQLATTSPATSSEPAATIADSRPSIAVLPFDNRSKLEDDVFFVDGIYDDILTQLSKVSGMRVISRTSVEQFRGTKLPIKNIAEQLGVAQVLEGGVQRAGDRVRVTVQLIDANTDAHLWAENYDRELTAANIFAIQSEVATAIAAALKATLTADEKMRLNAIPTQNLEAWEAYQIGKQRMAKRTSAALADAGSFFREAIDLDPEFALAHVGLGDSLRLQTEYSGAPLESALSQAEHEVEVALDLEPNLAEAWASSGGLAYSKARFDRAEDSLRRAIELNPNYAAARHWYSLVLNETGQRDESLVQIQRAAQLDPLSMVINVTLGDSLMQVGRFEEAAARYRKAMQVDPESPSPYIGLGTLNAYARNRFVAAVPLADRALALDADSPLASAVLGMLRLDMDDAPEATRLISAATSRWPDEFYANAYAAALYGALGDVAAAERHARRALAAWPRDYRSVAILGSSDIRKGDAKAARARYASIYPELQSATNPKVDASNYQAAIDLAVLLQKTGELDRATELLNGSEQAILSISRLGFAGYYAGYGIADVRIHALRGDTAKSLAALREAEIAGWRGPAWRYYRDFDPALTSIRDEPEFNAVFADIERDMARQRAELAARPKDAPLELELH
jgi:TolB-like protein/Tfp pilus assembly protein PilF